MSVGKKKRLTAEDAENAELRMMWLSDYEF
jgi:hypothetical protein